MGCDSRAWAGGTSCRGRSQQAFLPSLSASGHFHRAARVWKWAIGKRVSFTHGCNACASFYFGTYVNHVNTYTVTLKQQHSLCISKSYGCFSERQGREAKYHFNFWSNLCFWLFSSLENLLANIFTFQIKGIGWNQSSLKKNKGGEGCYLAKWLLNVLLPKQDSKILR